MTLKMYGSKHAAVTSFKVLITKFHLEMKIVSPLSSFKKMPYEYLLFRNTVTEEGIIIVTRTTAKTKKNTKVKQVAESETLESILFRSRSSGRYFPCRVERGIDSGKEKRLI